MSASRVNLGDLMAVVHDKWATSQGLRKLRRYFFSQWLPYNRAYGGTDDVRFWKWQVYHSPPGSSYTNNPTEHFNCELKDACTYPFLLAGRRFQGTLLCLNCTNNLRVDGSLFEPKTQLPCGAIVCFGFEAPFAAMCWPYPTKSGSDIQG
ncbi:hypothetical protein H257_17246 [Aphanomyces astaci]|uniref:Uncharacterized protein n=1 Tax=Aphanomyces astaci TaxID=112090 RepID=W4FHQ6_APHAT|nr:hypothetical protein H257_17246 [Aphanomyces astaci]ETV66278.1 hypothetical protein H257_17246 [Aphanomyces astaci]|eukprot:XP_009844265.1 hypothetical protein H257_17246 [Aphanomyces astaci]